MFEAISGGAAQSWQMDNRWTTMARGEFDFGFAVDWMRKDLGLIASTKRGRRGAKLPLTALVDQFYADVQAMGGGRQDTSVPDPAGSKPEATAPVSWPPCSLAAPALADTLVDNINGVSIDRDGTGPLHRDGDRRRRPGDRQLLDRGERRPARPTIARTAAAGRSSPA